MYGHRTQIERAQGVQMVSKGQVTYWFLYTVLRNSAREWGVGGIANNVLKMRKVIEKWNISRNSNR